MYRSMNIKSLTLAISALVLSTGVNASIVDQGNSTFDTDTELVWLDVTETLGMSYNQVLNQLGEGDQFYGYRYATADELQVLLTNIGFSGVSTTPNTSLVFSGESALLEQTIQLLGDTARDAFVPQFDGDVLLSGQTWGMVEWCCNSLTGDTFPTAALLQDSDYGDTSGGSPFYHYDYIQIYNGSRDKDSFNDELGSFLVEGVYEPVSAVPVPAAVWLFGSGLIGLIGVARRKKHND